MLAKLANGILRARAYTVDVDAKKARVLNEFLSVGKLPGPYYHGKFVL